MPRRYLVLLALAPFAAIAQSTCPQVNFLTPRSVNLKPSATSHIDVVRQSDGSYTGFEVADAAPYRTIALTPHFEKQFAACLPHTIPSSPSTAPVTANPPGAGSQMQVSETLANGNIFVARISNDGLQYTVFFDVFDSQHNLLSEVPFTSVVTPPGYVGSANETFESLALADLNGDGKLDLLAVFDTPLAEGTSYGGVWTFLGNGDGTFQTGNRQVLSSVGMAAAALTIAVGDLNGDGKPDLVLSRALSAAPLILAFGNGDGTFSAQTQVISGACGSTVVIADLNGDGKADLVLAPCTNQQDAATAAVMLGNGNGTFQAASYYPALFAMYPLASFALAVGDLNGDGIPDIATSGGTILTGDGKGGFPSRKDYPSMASGSVMLADFDGDGKTDIIFGTGNADFLSGSESNSSLTVLFGSDGGAFVGAPVSSAVAGTLLNYEYQPLAAADFNGDGIPDIALADSTDEVVSILLGQGNGQFSQGLTKNFTDSPVAVAAADFNHDGKPDLAVLVSTSNGEGEVQVYPGLGDGTLGSPFVVPVPAESVNFVAAPDVNGDGIPDLVVTTTSTLLVWLGKGDGTFSGPTFVQGLTSSPAVAFGDFNGDGKLDIVIAGTFTLDTGNLNVGVLLGKGDGTFAGPVSSYLPGQVSGVPNSMVAADFNGDGNLDLAVAFNVGFTSQIAVMFGQGNGQFPRYNLTQGTAPLYVADVNGDKIPDLISGAVPNGTAVQLGNGDGTFEAAVPIFPQTSLVAIADFNRDGTLDLAMSFGPGVVALLNLSQPPAPLTVVSAATFEPGPLAPDSIASAFGEFIPSGSGAPLTAGVIAIMVQDSSGTSRSATLLYLSSTQINFLVPAATALGPATVTMYTSGKQLSAQVQIAAVAPSLFTVGASIAAAYAVQVAPGGAQTVEPVFTSQNGTVAAVPISVNQPGQVYLTLFGTGFDTASLNSTSATVQGLNAPVTYAGPQSSSSGLDQINLLLPPSLAGTGLAGISVSIGGAVSNTAYVTIQ